MAQITEILFCFRMPVLKRSQLENDSFSKKKNCYGSFVYVSTLREKVFSGAPVKCVFLYGSKNSDSVVFKNVGFAEIKDHSLRRTPSQKTVCNRGCVYMSTLREKVFSGALVNCFFLYGSNNSDSVVFRNAGFGEMKDHTSSTIDFCKSFLTMNFLVGDLISVEKSLME